MPQPQVKQARGVAERLLDTGRGRLGARRWVLCLPQSAADGEWSAHAAEPQLRDPLLARVAAETARPSLVDVGSLDELGGRLLASGVERLLVVPYEAGAVVFEDPDPAAAHELVAGGRSPTLALVPSLWRTEAAAERWRTLQRWLPALDEIATGTTTPEQAAAALSRVLGRELTWEASEQRLRGGEDVDGIEAFSRLLADVAAAAVSGEDARRNALLRERARIASVIHEGITQVLTNVAIQLDVLDHLLDDPDQARATVRSSRDAVLEALDSLRTVIFDLTPAVEEWQDLAGGVKGFVADFSSQWGLDVDVTVSGRERELDAEVVSVAFAFVQEALTNVRKHTETATASVTIAFRDTDVWVEVCDQGGGMDVDVVEAAPDDELRSRQGLKIMESRIRLLNGRMTLRSQPGEGTCVRMVVPG